MPITGPRKEAKLTVAVLVDWRVGRQMAHHANFILTTSALKIAIEHIPDLASPVETRLRTALDWLE